MGRQNLLDNLQMTINPHQKTWVYLKNIFLRPTFPKLVGGIPTPLKNMSSSVGMIIPIYGKKTNHQPENNLGNYTGQP